MPEAQAAGAPALIAQFLPMVLIFAVFYFMLIMPQRKKDKKFKQMLAALSVGDEVVTIGGICGKVIRIKDDTITVETGADKTKLTFKKWAVKEVVQMEQA